MLTWQMLAVTGQGAFCWVPRMLECARCHRMTPFVVQTVNLSVWPPRLDVCCWGCAP